MFGDPRLPERFWSKVRVDEVTGCHIWVAARSPLGYGAFGLGRKTYRAHRVAYEAIVGPAVGMDLDHLCRVPACVNVAHLEAVDHATNCRRGVAGESAKARQSGKTHCKFGHPFAGDNVRVNRHGYRLCVACARRYKVEQKERRVSP